MAAAASDDDLGTVSRIKVVDTIDVGGSPAGVAVGNGLVWVTVD